jgi:hypothetical protein
LPPIPHDGFLLITIINPRSLFHFSTPLPFS